MKNRFYFFLISLFCFPVIFYGKIYFGNFYLNKETLLKEHLIIVGDEAKIKGNVIGDITFYGKELTISGEVTGNIFFVGNKFYLKNSCKITGNIHFVGSKFIIEDGAIIHGNVNNRFFWRNLKYFPLKNKNPFQIPVNFIIKFFLIFLVFILFSDYIKRVVYTVRIQPVISFFKGFVFLFIMVLLAILLFLSLFGAPIAILLLFVLLFLLLFASTAVSYFLGNLLIKNNQKFMEFLKLFIGFSIIYIINFVPILTVFYYIFILLTFFGALYHTKSYY